MKKKHYYVASVISLIICLGCLPALGTETGEQTTTETKQEPQVMSLERCIEYALENSLDLKQTLLLEEQKEEEQDKADFYSRKLKNGKNSIQEGKQSLDQAKQRLEKVEQGLALNPNDPILLAQKQALEAGIKAGEINLNQGEQALYTSIQGIKEGMQDVDSTRELMETKADVGVTVAAAGVEIQKKGIALQVQNAYYNVLKQQRLVDVRQAALDRAIEQYEFAKNSYDIGMSAKDEYILADIQVKAMRVKLLEAQNNLNGAKMELKKIMNMDLAQDLICHDDFTTESIEVNLEEGIQQGRKKRLEVLKAEGELLIYQLNSKIMKKSYTSNTFYVREADLQERIAEVNYQKQLQDVEGSIRNSHAGLETTKAMFAEVKNMKQQAEENLNIATYKYQLGFGEESKLLKQMDIESLSGTIMEVMVAQEKLAEVEEAVVNVIYSYNMAAAKYFFDIGTY